MSSRASKPLLALGMRCEAYHISEHMRNTRQERDLKTLEAMGRIFCAAHHGGGKDASGLCPSCRMTVDATFQRAALCPNGHEGNCQDCLVHCQRGEAQARIREIMRYSAPRMAFCHPLMTADYLRKKLRSR